MPDQSQRAEAALKKLLAHDGNGLYASDGLLFNHTVFGRDVCMISLWLLELGDEYKLVARDVILTLARLQGIRTNRRSEEEPGRILNQYKLYDNWRASWLLKTSGRAVSTFWGGNWDHELTYIGLDSTPLFVLLVSNYAAIDTTIFAEEVTRRDGSVVTVKQSVKEAVNWMIKGRQKHGFVARRRRNPVSLFFQSWRDSHLAYLHPDGRLASLSRPVVYLEVQLLAVDALRAVAHALPDESATGNWRTVADELASLTLERFWLPEHEYFAAALDPDRNGRLRPLLTPASSPGWMLDSTIFEGVPHTQLQAYLKAIVRRLGSSEFITKAGIRARGNGSDSGLGVADYHGSWTVWPMDTFKYARGLRRQGMPKLAHDLERRIQEAVEAGGSFYEYFLVSPAGEVLWRPHEKPAVKPKRNINIQIMPERDLGWTITACIMMERQRIEPVGEGAWRGQLEDEVLEHLSHQPDRPQPDAPFGVRRIRGAVKVALKAGDAAIREYIFKA